MPVAFNASRSKVELDEGFGRVSGLYIFGFSFTELAPLGCIVWWIYGLKDFSQLIKLIYSFIHLNQCCINNYYFGFVVVGVVFCRDLNSEISLLKFLVSAENLNQNNDRFNIPVRCT